MGRYVKSRQNTPKHATTRPQLQPSTALGLFPLPAVLMLCALSDNVAGDARNGGAILKRPHYATKAKHRIALVCRMCADGLYVLLSGYLWIPLID